MAAEAVAALRSGPWGSVFGDVLGTLEGAAAAQPELVVTLSSQLGSALASLPLKAGNPVVASAPLLEADLRGATCLLKGLSCLSPRGRFDLALFPDRALLLSKGNLHACTVPLHAVAHVLLLEKPLEGLAGSKAASVRTVYFMLPLVPDCSVDFGKQKLTALLLSCTSAEQLSTTHPASAQPLVGAAPEVLAQALGAAFGRALELPSATSFRSARGQGCVSAHVKVTPGLLYPLRCGLAFVTPSKPLFLATAGWDGVEIGRAGGGTNASFDLTVGAPGKGAGTEFALISRDELPALQEYVAGRTRALQKKADAVAVKTEAPPSAPPAPSDSEHSSDDDDEDFKASEGAGDSGGSGSGSDSDDEEGGAGGDSSSDDAAAFAIVPADDDAQQHKKPRLE